MRIQDLIRRLMDFPLDSQVYTRDPAGGEDIYIISEVFEQEHEMDDGKMGKGVVIG